MMAFRKGVQIYASRCCCHMGKEQSAGVFVIYGHMSDFEEKKLCYVI